MISIMILLLHHSSLSNKHILVFAWKPEEAIYQDEIYSLLMNNAWTIFNTKRIRIKFKSMTKHIAENILPLATGTG